MTTTARTERHQIFVELSAETLIGEVMQLQSLAPAASFATVRVMLEERLAPLAPPLAECTCCSPDPIRASLRSYGL
jgi:hypothetical protein